MTLFERNVNIGSRNIHHLNFRINKREYLAYATFEKNILYSYGSRPNGSIKHAILIDLNGLMCLKKKQREYQSLL